MANPKGNLTTLRKYQPKWRSGQTHTIRVPVALTDQILDYAHQLDAGVATLDQSGLTHADSLSQVIEWLKAVEDTSRTNFSKQKRELVRKAIVELQSLSQVNR